MKPLVQMEFLLGGLILVMKYLFPLQKRQKPRADQLFSYLNYLEGWTQRFVIQEVWGAV